MATINFKLARKYLEAFDFQKLFIEVLFWGRPKRKPAVLTVDGVSYHLTPVAEMGDMVVFQCEPAVGSGSAGDGLAGAGLPLTPARSKIERQVSKLAFEHILIFTDKGHTKATWHWVKREQGSARTRTHTYARGQRADLLLQKLANIAFSIKDLDEEGRVAIGVVTDRTAKAFDVETVTKRFYEEFKSQHAAFLKFLRGIPAVDEQAWYVSVMLNRLMFIYFIQKKAFLAGDPDYLRHKLEESQARGKDHFYRDFLLVLFFEGFAHDVSQRSAETKKLLGSIPYLNGGLFMPHELEERYGKTINIPDAAFERIFAFFDKYTWHLDDRPWHDGNEINPDVLGYIFEKYINQKQMGAYYTKEDITGYICRNTILPRLFDMLAEHRYGAVHPLPLHDIEPYIYEAVKQAEYLPTETEREYQARQTRLASIRADFAAGKFTSTNDLITYNLDIEKFARDWLAELDDPLVLRAFYFECLKKVTVLDPTCGSGAFLFAALNILEPLYEICLERMAELASPKYPDFTEELSLVARRPNRAYFIYKSCIVNNLYGVDIMPEAVEICRLRLFLKLVAQVEPGGKIEPLPDIDFNILTGNTLIGYTTEEQARAAVKYGSLFNADIEERIAEAARALSAFRELQTRLDTPAGVMATAKQGVREKLEELEDDLNFALTNEYQMDMSDFMETHRPFHWYVEFHEIMREGGFDVIVGNPPYVAASKVRRDYNVRGFVTGNCPDIYAWVLERSASLARLDGRTGMIVPLSLGFSSDFDSCRRLLFSKYSVNWFSSFGRIPSALFSFDVRVRNTIHLGYKAEAPAQAFTTRLHRWFMSERPSLFQMLAYAPFTPALWKYRIPKLNTIGLALGFERLLRSPSRVLENDIASRPTSHTLYFKSTAYNWLNFCREMPPCYENGRPVAHTQFDSIFLADRATRDLFELLSDGKLMLAFWFAVGDDFHVTRGNVAGFPATLSSLSQQQRSDLLALSPELTIAMEAAVQFKLNAGRRVGNYNLAKCRNVTDRSDLIFAEALGLREVWEDIELYYAQTVKTDFAAGDED